MPPKAKKRGPIVPPSVPHWNVGNALTPRERLIVRLIADGYTDREIAQCLARSVLTVREHVKRVYAKLGVHRRTILVRWAMESRARVAGIA